MTIEETAVYEYLNKLGIAFELARHPKADTIADCAVAERLLGGRMPKNLFLAPRNQSAYYLCLMHPDSEFHTSVISKQAGASRLSFAGSDAMWRMLRARPGAVSPLGLIFDANREVKLLIDTKLLGEEAMLFHPLDNTASVKLSRDDFLERFLKSLNRAPTYVCAR